MSNELDMLIQSEPCGEFYRDKNVLLKAHYADILLTYSVLVAVSLSLRPPTLEILLHYF